MPHGAFSPPDINSGCDQHHCYQSHQADSDLDQHATTAAICRLAVQGCCRDPPVEPASLIICSAVVMSALNTALPRLLDLAMNFDPHVHFGRAASSAGTGGISGFDRTVGVPASIRCSTLALLRFLQKGLAFAGKASIAVA